MRKVYCVWPDRDVFLDFPMRTSNIRPATTTPTGTATTSQKGSNVIWRTCALVYATYQTYHQPHMNAKYPAVNNIFSRHDTFLVASMTAANKT